MGAILSVTAVRYDRLVRLDPGVRTTVVFSHPNHELAVFGLMQRLRPDIIYITDGGGRARENESREGLERIGLLDRALFLGHSEDSLYAALLDRDLTVLREIIGQVRTEIRRTRPEQLLCDAVELYNPLHDLARPIVRAALDDSSVPVWEIPLVYQTVDPGEHYVVQRPVSSRCAEAETLELTPVELDHKLRARDDVYTLLVEQMGPVITGISSEDCGVEFVMPAAESLPLAGTDVTLRYEWRSGLLVERGEIGRRITCAGHYLPLVKDLETLPAV
jgi:hypothetical protein